MMKTLLWIGFLCAAALASACNGPVLQNVPKPNSAVVAGAAAATAAAITLASPDAQARRVAAEEAWRRPSGRPLPSSGQTAPADVLDRLDAAERQRQADPDAAPPPSSASPIFQRRQPLTAPPSPGVTPFSPSGLPFTLPDTHPTFTSPPR